MKFTLVEEKKQPLLGRRELLYLAEYPQAATPSKTDLKRLIVAATKAPENLIVIHKLITSFGTQQAQVDVLIYDNEQSYNKYGVIHKQKKKEEPAAGAAAAPTGGKK